MTIHRLLATNHPVQCLRPNLLVRSPPLQLESDTVAQYFQHYKDFIDLRAFLEGNRRCLDDQTELDKFIAGLTHSGKIFLISREERISNDPVVQ